MDPIGPIIAEERRRPLRRREYDLLIKQGVLGEEKIELLFGTLVRMSPVPVDQILPPA